MNGETYLGGYPFLDAEGFASQLDGTGVNVWVAPLRHLQQAGIIDPRPNVGVPIPRPRGIVVVSLQRPLPLPLINLYKLAINIARLIRQLAHKPEQDIQPTFVQQIRGQRIDTLIKAPKPTQSLPRLAPTPTPLPRTQRTIRHARSRGRSWVAFRMPPSSSPSQMIHDFVKLI